VSARLNRRLRDERGQIIVLAAVMVPVFLLMSALVVDAGNWYTHKRSLQNRADAGALAAGLQYISELKNCQVNPGPVGATIGNIAKQYAGTNESVGTTYNKHVNKQSNITVAINAASPTSADWTDGGGPCATSGGAHTTGDGWSANGGIWTDVKVRESNIGTLFRSFGISLPQIAAQARVEVKQIIGVRDKGLPFINETGDQIECAWAQFVRARDGSSSGFTVTPSNPVQLTEGPNNTWTANNVSVAFTNAHDDVAIRYWAGSKNGSAPCSFAAATKGPLPHAFDNDLTPVQIDWLNVYDTGAAPILQAPPKLRRFSLNADTCGGPGFLYTSSTDVNETCRVGYTAEVDNGVNNVSGTITVNPIGTGVDPVSVDYNGAGIQTVSGTITVRPNHTRSPSSFSQDYDEVGATYLSVSWEQTSGQVNGKNCPQNNNCRGTFQGETVNGVGSDIQQQFYMADPLASVPMIGTNITTSSRSYPALGSSGSFSITFQHTAVDPDHIVLIRDSVQSSGNRTRAIYCGNSPGQGAAALANAIRYGCDKDLVRNTRSDSCSPAPLSSANPWDCVQLEQGNKTSINKGVEDRFACTNNNWGIGPGPGGLPADGDQRWAYIILTGYGRTFPAGNGDWLPVEGLLRVYVTGWDGGASCNKNDPAPRGYDDKGAQLWGHLVEPITIDPAVIVGDAKCNLDNDNIQCSPGLVR
jgi:Flp pilus assembly protein TadG